MLGAGTAGGVGGNVGDDCFLKSMAGSDRDFFRSLITFGRVKGIAGVWYTVKGAILVDAESALND